MQSCIRRFDRVFDGNIGSTMKSKYTCKAKYAWQRGVETSLFATTLGLRITAGTADCDESKQFFPL
jgi:hypothetical protein